MTQKLVTKLVRNEIPERFKERPNNQSAFIQLNPETYGVALAQKLMEEAYEVVDAPDKENLTQEIGDVLDILDALMEHHQIDIKDVQNSRNYKASEWGTYSDRWFVVGHPKIY